MRKEYPHIQRSRKVEEILGRAEAVTRGTHVVLSSGEHSSVHIDTETTQFDWRDAEEMCRDLAEEFIGEKIDVVVGTREGTITLAHELAKRLGIRSTSMTFCAYAEKTGDGEFALKHKFNKHIAGKHVLVVDDVINSGSTVKSVVRLVRRLGGIVVGVAALVNRGRAISEMIGNPPKFVALLDIDLKAETWPEKPCPLCRAGVSINTEVGNGKEFLQKQRTLMTAS